MKISIKTKNIISLSLGSKMSQKMKNSRRPSKKSMRYSHRLSSSADLSIFPSEIIIRAMGFIARFKEFNWHIANDVYDRKYSYIQRISKRQVMIVVNPCSFYQEHWPIPFHRNIAVFVVMLDLCLFLLLRLLTLFFRSGHKQQIDDIVRRNVKNEVLRVEQIKLDLNEQTNMVLNDKSTKKSDSSNADTSLVKKQKSKEESQSSQSSEQSNQQVHPQSGSDKERYLIELKRLKITPSEFINAYVIMAGHRSICLALAMLYYPLAYVSMLAVAQTILKIIWVILKMCGYRGKWLTFLNGSIYFLNIVILIFSIYGMETRVPKNDGLSCFDL